MKTIAAPLAAHQALPATTLAYALKITRSDAQVFGFTSNDRDVTLGGVLHKASPGLDVTSIATSAGLAVDNLELSTLDDGTVFNRVDVLAGIWNNAAFSLVRYNWASPTDGTEVLLAGTLGEVTLRRSMVVAELRGLQQALQQTVGSVSTKTCRNRLGDARCGVNLAAYTFAGTVTTATSRQQFTAAALTQAADYFGEGVLTWTSGPNSGLSAKVKTHATGGVLTLSLPMLQNVALGNTFSVVAGCRKRHDRTLANPGGVSDCFDKFDNVLNFRGEPHRPTVDDLTESPEPGV